MLRSRAPHEDHFVPNVPHVYLRSCRKKEGERVATGKQKFLQRNSIAKKQTLKPKFKNKPISNYFNIKNVVGVFGRDEQPNLTGNQRHWRLQQFVVCTRRINVPKASNLFT